VTPAKVEVGVSLLPNANKGLFKKAGVQFEVGEEVVPFEDQVWLGCQSSNPSEKQVEHFIKNNAAMIPEGYLNDTFCNRISFSPHQVTG
jgi:hypothetical protein